MRTKFLTAIPVFNEVAHVEDVIAHVRQYSSQILVVDDGSTDGTSEFLAGCPDIHLATHAENRGYGAALLTAFDYALQHDFDWLVTIDCDGQHAPQRIPVFVDLGQSRQLDLVSGSRYLQQFQGDNEPPPGRLRVNQLVTAELNQRLGLELTDAFCGFKAYRVARLADLNISEVGYAMPLELWVQAAAARWRIQEHPVPRIYTGENRSFGTTLDDDQTRLDYYHLVIQRSLDAMPCDGPRCSIDP